MRPNPWPVVAIVMLVTGLCLCIWNGAVCEANAQTGYKLVSVFLAIGVQSARLTCDGEAIEVQSHTSEVGDVEIVSVVCDSIGPWPGGEWVEAVECSVTREEGE